MALALIQYLPPSSGWKPRATLSRPLSRQATATDSSSWHRSHPRYLAAEVEEVRRQRGRLHPRLPRALHETRLDVAGARLAGQPNALASSWTRRHSVTILRPIPAPTAHYQGRDPYDVSSTAPANRAG